MMKKDSCQIKSYISIQRQKGKQQVFSATSLFNLIFELAFSNFVFVMVSFNSMFKIQNNGKREDVTHRVINSI